MNKFFTFFIFSLLALVGFACLCFGVFLFATPAPEATAVLTSNMADVLSGLLLFCLFSLFWLYSFARPSFRQMLRSLQRAYPALDNSIHRVFAAAMLMAWALGVQAQTVVKQLYFSDPAQALDRVDPVATADGTTAQTATLFFAAGVAGTFVAPVDVSNQLGDNSITPDLAVHTSGGTETVHMVFLSKATGASKKNIYYASKTGAGSWSVPVLISSDAFNQDAQPYTSIAVDANNKAYVVYSHKNSTDSKINIYYVTNVSGAWSAPVRISSDAFNQDADTPEIALDASGKAYVVYEHKSGSDSKKNIYYVTNVSGSWSVPVRISSDAFNNDVLLNPAIAVDASNKAHVAYTHKSSTDSKANIYYVTDASGSWSVPVRISSDAFAQDAQPNPSIALDGSGIPHVVYAHKNNASDAKINIYYVNKTSGSWSVPVDLSNDLNGQDSKKPDLAVSSGSNIVRVAFSNNVDNIFYTENSGAGNSWTTPVDLNPATPTKSTDGDNAAVAITSSNVHVAFQDKHVTLSGDIDVWHISAPLGTSSSATTTFSQTPSLCSNLTVKAGQAITVTAYVSIVSGSMPASPSITAALKLGTVSTQTMTTPSFSGGLLTWTVTLVSDVTIPSGQTISVDITTAQAGVSFKIDYDSQTKPSKIALPTSTYIDITSLAIYNAAFPGGAVIASATIGSTVYLRSVVTDPFGFADITAMNVVITPPGNSVAATSVATATCTRTYEYVWNGPVTPGSFALSATAKEGFENTVTDNATGSFMFTIVCPNPNCGTVTLVKNL